MTLFNLVANRSYLNETRFPCIFGPTETMDCFSIQVNTLNPFDKEARQKLQAKIAAAPVLSEKEWLLGAVAEG